MFNFIQSKNDRHKEPTILRYDTLDNLFYDRDISNDIEVSLNGNRAFITNFGAVNTFFHLVNPNPEFMSAKKNFFKQGLSIDEIMRKGQIMPSSVPPGSYNSKFAMIDINGQSTGNAENIVENRPRENPIRRYEFKEGGYYQDIFTGFLKTSGENLFTIVQNNPAIRKWVTSFFKEFKLEFLMDFSSRKFEIQKRRRGISYKIPFELTPDTFRRMLFHVAAIYSNIGTTILLEEPESHSFPPYINELSELIKADSNNTYFITTHSPYFFNNMIESSQKIRDISFFHMYYSGYQTHIIKLTRKDLDTIWANGVDVFFNIYYLNR